MAEGYYYTLGKAVLNRRGLLPIRWAKHPKKYGLYILNKRDDGSVRPPTPEDMVASSDDVVSLLWERKSFKPAERGIVAIIMKAQRIECFEEAIQRDKQKASPELLRALDTLLKG